MEEIEISHSSVLAARQTVDPATMPPRPKAPAWVNDPNAPSVLYDGMIAPIIPCRRFKHTDGALVARAVSRYGASPSPERTGHSQIG